jgi:hypothetical protein
MDILAQVDATPKICPALAMKLEIAVYVLNITVRRRKNIKNFFYLFYIVSFLIIQDNGKIKHTIHLQSYSTNSDDTGVYTESCEANLILIYTYPT